MSNPTTSAPNFYSERLLSRNDTEVEAYLAKCTKVYVLELDKDVLFDTSRFIDIDLGSQFVHDILNGIMEESDKEHVFKQHIKEIQGGPKPDMCYVTWPGYKESIEFPLSKTFKRANLKMDQVTKGALKRHIAGAMRDLYMRIICGDQKCDNPHLKLGYGGISLRQIRLVKILMDSKGNWRAIFDVVYKA